MVSASALTKLQGDFSENADFLEIISINSARAQDLSFALSFVEPGPAQRLPYLVILIRLMRL